MHFRRQQLNLDKSEAMIVGTSSQLQQVLPAVPSLTVAGVNLPVSEQMKMLGVILDRRLTFEKHATAVAKSYKVTALKPSITYDISRRRN